jgi:hypothetical protein
MTAFDDQSPDQVDPTDARSMAGLERQPTQIASCYTGDIVISGVGYHHPEETLSNDELVAAYNRYADDYNAQNQALIAQNRLSPLAKTTAQFIEKAAGIRSRYVRDKRKADGHRRASLPWKTLCH